MPASVCVTFQLPDTTSLTLRPGDLIGRLPSAALYLNDLRISEAHAMVSLRGEQLKLLALRGRFAVDGTLETEVVLEEGLVIELAPALELTVLEVELPLEVLALEGPDLPRQMLHDPMSLLLLPRPSLHHKFIADAAAHLWSAGDDWYARVAGGATRILRAGDSWDVGSLRFRAVANAVASAALADTHLELHAEPLQLVARYDIAHIHRSGQPTVTLDGVLGRLLSELVAMHGAAPWEVVAGEVWPTELDRAALRRRWDVYMARLRRRLRGARIRPSLVRATGLGTVELFLLPQDSAQEVA